MQWKDVLGFEGHYQVSYAGQVRNVQSGHVLRGSMRGGYVNVSLYLDGVRHMRAAHQVVCQAFLGPSPIGHVPNHINGVRNDNRVENLEYVTRSQNIRLGKGPALTRVMMLSERNPSRKLSERMVSEIRERRSAGEKLTVLAPAFGISYTHVWMLVHGYRRAG